MTVITIYSYVVKCIYSSEMALACHCECPELSICRFVKSFFTSASSIALSVLCRRLLLDDETNSAYVLIARARSAFGKPSASGLPQELSAIIELF